MVFQRFFLRQILRGLYWAPERGDRWTIFDKEKAEARAHILEGLLIALITSRKWSGLSAVADRRWASGLNDTNAFWNVKVGYFGHAFVVWPVWKRDKIQSEYDDLLFDCADLLIFYKWTCGDHHQGRTKKSNAGLAMFANWVDGREVLSFWRWVTWLKKQMS